MEQKGRISIKFVNEYTTWDEVSRNSYSLRMRGYTFIDELYYSGDKLVRYISDHLEEVPAGERISVLKDLIPRLNGCWALVYEADNDVLAAVDRLRSIPLFYAMKNGRVFLSGNAREVLKCLNNAELDDICAAEFLVTGYVTGKDTLYKGLYQIQPGEILEVKISKNASPRISTHRYYRFTFGSYFEAGEQELEEELSKLWHRIFSRYAIALKGKTPIIPLSGGWDSRLIVAMLKKCGVENVICFSYGRHGNAEAETSRAVAKALGYEWLFCPYDEMSWYNWFREGRMSEYLNYGHNYSSVSNIQDWPATRKILSDISANDVVFVPGLTLGFIAGSQVPNKLYYAEENSGFDMLVPEVVLSRHYWLWSWHNVCPHLKDPFVERIRDVLPIFSNWDKLAAIGSYETWEGENRQARHIINSVRVYESFNCQWMLPCVDVELIDFFLRVKLCLRFQKKLYRSTMIHKVFVDDLGHLSRIPVIGLPLPGYEVRRDESYSYSLCRSVYRVLKRFMPLGNIMNIYNCWENVSSQRNDLLARSGRWVPTEGGRRLCYFRAFQTKLRDCFSIRLDQLPRSVRCIVEPSIDKPVLSHSIVGLNALHNLTRVISEDYSDPG